MEIKTLAEAEKRIAFFPGWSKPEEDDGYSHFQAPLGMGEIVQAGLFLNGGTYLSVPDRHVTFEVVLLTGGGARRQSLMRLDWRSLRGGHTNQKRHGCPEGCPKRTTETHFHAFDINWNESAQRMRGPRLPCAVDVQDDLPTFETLREYVGNHFKINNIEIVSVPEWEYKLGL